VNELWLNFNKTQYIHFKTKRKISDTLTISYNNKFINDIPCTKFLGIMIDGAVTWKNHTDLLIKKLSKACYVIRNMKSCMSTSALKAVYLLSFIRKWAMASSFGEIHIILSTSFSFRKRQLE
jgi:hypothetical protein